MQLFHAMMAVSALSLAHQNGVQRIVAFQHYQQALPSLQSNLRLAQDLSSNGTFLTVFLLLIYEVCRFALSLKHPLTLHQIAAAEPGISNLWQQHMAQLLRISLMRREIFGGERYPFIIWLVCNIDIYAVFSGAGSGEFVETLMKNNIIPPPDSHQHPLGTDGSSIIYPEESDTLPTVLQLRYNVSVRGARLGLLAQELRKEARGQTYADEPFMTQKRIDTRVRQRRILKLQEEFRHLWTVTNIVMLEQRLKLLPRRSKEIFQQVSERYCFAQSSIFTSEARGRLFADVSATRPSKVVEMGHLDSSFTCDVVLPLKLTLGVISSPGRSDGRGCNCNFLRASLQASLGCCPISPWHSFSNHFIFSRVSWNIVVCSLLT
jgi:hypothetical protein